MPAVIDTNILIELLKKPPNVTVAKNAATYRRGGNRFLIFPIVYFEYRRAALENGRDTEGRARALDAFVSNECEWIPLDQAVAQKASWLWSRNPRSTQVGDADVLIASVALHNRVPVATRNRRHIGRFGVDILDWFEDRPKAIRTRRVP